MSTLNVTSPTNLIVGCGYLGRRVAARWLAQGQAVAALTRGNEALLAKQGIRPIVGDVLNPATLKGLPQAKTVLYAVGWDRSTGKSMREIYLAGLGHVLDTLPGCDRFIYASSTGVYGQMDGSWVDEGSPMDPVEQSGMVVRDAERLLLEKRPDAIILRFAGMYGPNRLLRKQAILAGEPLVGDAERWLNLIQIDDGAEAVLQAELRAKPGDTYNIADNAPPKRRQFYTRLAELLAAPVAQFEQRAEAGQANRRVSNAKAQSQLNWLPRYPSYQTGLVAAVEGSEEAN